MKTLNGRGQFKVVTTLACVGTLLAVQVMPQSAAYAFFAESPASLIAPTETFQGASLNQTYSDEGSNSFALFHHQEAREIPTFLGRSIYQEGRTQFEATQKIESRGDFYLLTNPQDVSFLQVLEKLPEGGFGRILKHRSQGIDLEFIYEDKEGIVTILDYNLGRFFRITFTETPKAPLAFNPEPKDSFNPGEIIATLTSTSKFTVTPTEFLTRPDLRLQRLHSLIKSLDEKADWNARHLRGPPQGEVTP